MTDVILVACLIDGMEMMKAIAGGTARCAQDRPDVVFRERLVVGAEEWHAEELAFWVTDTEDGKGAPALLSSSIGRSDDFERGRQEDAEPIHFLYQILTQVAPLLYL